jgi:pyroglutamyl-peptidase
VHFGVSARARGFVIETRAVNQTSHRADCEGAEAAGRCVRANAAASMASTLPTARLVQRLRAEGLPATLSVDAGRYLCNTVLFESLMLCAAHGTRVAGFVHIPPLPAPETGIALENGFGWPQLRRGAAWILETIARGT